MIDSHINETREQHGYNGTHSVVFPFPKSHYNRNASNRWHRPALRLDDLSTNQHRLRAVPMLRKLQCVHPRPLVAERCLAWWVVCDVKQFPITGLRTGIVTIGGRWQWPILAWCGHALMDTPSKVWTTNILTIKGIMEGPRKNHETFSRVRHRKGGNRHLFVNCDVRAKMLQISVDIAYVWWICRVMPYGVWHRVFWWKFTIVSDGRTPPRSGQTDTPGSS